MSTCVLCVKKSEGKRFQKWEETDNCISWRAVEVHAKSGGRWWRGGEAYAASAIIDKKRFKDHPKERTCVQVLLVEREEPEAASVKVHRGHLHCILATAIGKVADDGGDGDGCDDGDEGKDEGDHCCCCCCT